MTPQDRTRRLCALASAVADLEHVDWTETLSLLEREIVTLARRSLDEIDTVANGSRVSEDARLLRERVKSLYLHAILGAQGQPASGQPGDSQANGKTGD